MSHVKPLIAVVFAAVGLSACATLIEGSSQEVTFDAVGATNVECYIKNEEHSYKVFPPQRIWMKRSRLNMTADCFAPGNRRKQFDIVTGIEPTAVTNVSNGVAPGVTYDAYSRALFKYPSVIIFDMTDSVPTASLLPDYHNSDGLDPYAAKIEYMGPDTPALNDDATAAAMRKSAYAAYDRDQEFEAERTARMLEADPGVKK